MPMCKVNDCDKRIHAKGLCRKHYQRQSEVRAKRKQYYQRPEIKARVREYYQNNKPEILAYRKQYRARPKVKIRKKQYDQRPEQKMKHKKHMKEYRKRPEIKANRKKRYNLIDRLSVRVRTALSLYSKTGKIMTSKKYGIDYRAIIEYLKPFPEDREKYHIDHIIPLCKFNLNDLREIKRAFAPENHQWLTIQENLSKGKKNSHEDCV